MKKKIYILTIAFEAVMANKIRSILTALGIIFGVAAVISMLAIGNGAKKEILNQMKLIGVNNIIIKPKIIADKSDLKGQKKEKKRSIERFSKGLTLQDAESIADIIPTVNIVSYESTLKIDVISRGVKIAGQLTGVSNDFFKIFSINIDRGAFFNNEQATNGSPVCILGANIKNKLFANIDPIGSYIKCGSIWLKIIGVLNAVEPISQNIENIGISDYNNQIFAPLKTSLLRFRDRSALTASIFNKSGNTIISSGNTISFLGVNVNDENENDFNQLSRIVVQITDTKYFDQTVSAINQILMRRHSNVDDFEIIVPELLLKQEQRTKSIFNAVLGAIAGISLLVGGIGIMNIMLASVMERTKEIGVRKAIGANKQDVIIQFLLEAIIISLSGGVLGVILGVILSNIISKTTEIETIITYNSIFISFCVSVAIGVIFGYMPAKRAAKKDAIESLRYE